jgi:hypothetical protein
MVGGININLMENIYKELIQVSQQRKEAEKRINEKEDEFEKSISVDMALLDDLLDKEMKLKENVLSLLEQQKLSNVTVDDKTINRQVKRTKKIENPLLLKENILKNEAKIKEIFNIKGDFGEFIRNLFVEETKVFDKKTVDNIVDKFEKVEGSLLDGVNLIQTIYLVIK